MVLTARATNRHSMPLRESRKDDPAGTFDHSTALVSLLSPQDLNTSARNRLLSAGYPTLAGIAISIRGHPRTNQRRKVVACSVGHLDPDVPKRHKLNQQGR